jgi:hypothetical protein
MSVELTEHQMRDEFARLANLMDFDPGRLRDRSPLGRHRPEANTRMRIAVVVGAAVLTLASLVLVRRHEQVNAAAEAERVVAWLLLDAQSGMEASPGSRDRQGDGGATYWQVTYCNTGCRASAAIRRYPAELKLPDLSPMPVGPVVGSYTVRGAGQSLTGDIHVLGDPTKGAPYSLEIDLGHHDRIQFLAVGVDRAGFDALLTHLHIVTEDAWDATTATIPTLPAVVQGTSTVP